MNWPRPSRRAALGVIAGIAAFAATAALALTRNGGVHQPLALAPLATLGLLAPAPAEGPRGPEGVPISAGPRLASPRPLRAGQQIDGITCQTNEQVDYHIHVHLRIIVCGHSTQVPGGIGIAQPYTAISTSAGQFIAGATCFMWLHTHAADGILHVESPTNRTYTLGEFFDVWGQPLNHSRVGPARGHVTALVNGRVFTSDPRRIPLLAHNQIELEVSGPLVAPDVITFPKGL